MSSNKINSQQEDVVAAYRGNRAADSKKSRKSKKSILKKRLTVSSAKIPPAPMPSHQHTSSRRASAFVPTSSSPLLRRPSAFICPPVQQAKPERWVCATCYMKNSGECEECDFCAAPKRAMPARGCLRFYDESLPCPCAKCERAATVQKLKGTGVVNTHVIQAQNLNLLSLHLQQERDTALEKGATLLKSLSGGSASLSTGAPGGSRKTKSLHPKSYPAGPSSREGAEGKGSMINWADDDEEDRAEREAEEKRERRMQKRKERVQANSSRRRSTYVSARF